MTFLFRPAAAADVEDAYIEGDPAVFSLSRYIPPVHTHGVVLKVLACGPGESPSGMCFPAPS